MRKNFSVKYLTVSLLIIGTLLVSELIASSVEQPVAAERDDMISSSGTDWAGSGSSFGKSESNNEEGEEVRETFIQETGDIIPYIVIDGWAIFAGDIVIGEPDVINEEGVPLSALVAGGDPEELPPGVKSLTLMSGSKWKFHKGKYRVYYQIESSLNQKEEDEVLEAMNRIESVNPFISFDHVDTYDDPEVEGPPQMPEASVLIYKPKGEEEGQCFSMLGQWKYNQPLGLGSGCYQQSIITHELMHALGFTHEHQRSDRDDFIEIHWENITPESEGNFSKLPGVPYYENYGPYDLKSLMHYHSWAFSIDPGNLRTISVIWRNPGDSILVPDDRYHEPYLSRFDRKGLIDMYKPPVHRSDPEEGDN